MSLRKWSQDWLRRMEQHFVADEVRYLNEHIDSCAQQISALRALQAQMQADLRRLKLSAAQTASEPISAGLDTEPQFQQVCS